MWSKWGAVTAQRFNHTLSAYRALNVHVYIIQQPPVQNYYAPNFMYYYQHLMNIGLLSDDYLRNVSLPRIEYNKQQAEFLEFFSRYNRTRDVTVIRVDDLVCDKDVCLIGTGVAPYFKDTVHMSWIGAERLAHRLKKYVSY
jgi:hypothetical protein